MAPFLASDLAICFNFPMEIRKATINDIDSVSAVYERIHTAEERGECTIGWQRGVYPERATALAALERGDLFVGVENGHVVGTAILNQIQVDSYQGAPWEYPAKDDEVMVMHTLAIDPEFSRNGHGRAFAEYYERYARINGCHYLRMDTNERNRAARSFYKKLGYREIANIPCTFNGIEGVGLILLEKKI